MNQNPAFLVIWRIVIYLVLASLVLTACSPAELFGQTPQAPLPTARNTTPMRVGFIAPMTGVGSSFYLPSREGVELAVKEWNDKGGVLGRKIELLVEDGQCQAAPAEAAATRLIDTQKVKYLIGEICSGATIPVSEIANRKGVVQISPTSLNASVTVGADGKVKPYIFRACFTDEVQGQAMAKFALSRDLQTAFIITEDSCTYCQVLVDAFEKTFASNGGQVVGKASISASQPDFMDELSKATDSKAQVLYLPLGYDKVNEIATLIQLIGPRWVLSGSDAWDSSELNLINLDGAFYTHHYSADDPRPVVQVWRQKYGAAYQDDRGQPKEPDVLAALSYDATNLLLAAIEQAGVDDPARVKDSLAGLSWEGVTGKITFDALHNPIKPAAVIGIRDGQRKFIESVMP